MPRLPRRLFALMLAAPLFATACVAGGAKQFHAGETAYQSGDFEAAESAYKGALQQEPGNAQYTAALERVRREVTKKHEEQAKAREKAEDWAGASESWARASESEPNNAELKARKALSALKAKNLGPDAWYEEVNKVGAALPKNPIVEESLANARAKASQYHIALAEQLLGSSQGSQALTHYDRAKAIDPAALGLDPLHYDEAAVFSLMEQGDARLAEGDALEAHELYKKAYEKRPLPEIKSKLAKVKTKASAVLSKLENARALSQKGKRLEAIKVYESLAGTKGIPVSVEAELNGLKAEVSRAEAEKARAAAEAGDVTKAHRGLREAIHYSALERSALEGVKRALEEIDDGRPGKGTRTLEAAGVPATDPLAPASKAYATAVAKKTLEKARAISKKDAGGALALLSDLGPFEESIPAIKDLRRGLRAGSFQETLDEALHAAQAGKDGDAGSLLLAALSASGAPQEMRAVATEACDALKRSKYAESEIAFQRALALEPRSKLAQRGIEIAHLRRRDAQKQAIQILKSGSGDQARAVEVLAGVLKVEPNNEDARQGADLLLTRLSTAKSLSNGEAAKLIGDAARLSDVPSAAGKSVEEGRASLDRGDNAAAEGAFSRALDSVPGLKVAKLARDYVKQRALASLKSGARRAVAGDDGAAKDLAELLKKDPKDPEANAALSAILDKAKTAAKARNDPEAAHQLQIASLAVSPAPGVKLALDKGSSALGQGKMEDAEKAYSEALDLEPEGSVAKTGFEIAKNARVGQLTAAIEDAKKGGNIEQAREALKRSYAVDPNGADARKAFGDLLDEARKKGQAGDDRQAAALLDAANVVSKPDTAKKAIEDGNKLLAGAKHEEAEAAYVKVLAAGDSKVATAGKEIAHERRRAILVAASLELKNNGDLERGTKATRELLKKDPTSAEARAAIDGALAQAEKLAVSGDDKGAARLLRAAAEASGEGKALSGAMIRFESGKLAEAETELQKHESDLARRAIAIIRQRRLGTLKAGLAGDDRAQAESIKALLKSDPSNKDALAAFNKLLEKAKTAAAKGDDKAASEALLAASVASGAREDLASTISVAATHLGEGRYAQAERGSLDALELSSDSRVARTALDIAKKGRQRVEKSAVVALTHGDPGGPAKVLQASLLVEPNSKLVSSALAELLKRAKKSGDDVEVAKLLDAAALLENLGSDTIEKLGKADALFAKGSFEEAEAEYRALASVERDEGKNETRPSKVAASGTEIAHQRRIAVLRRELDAAKKDADVLGQSTAAQKILVLDPKDKGALEASKKLHVSVVETRLSTARAQKEAGHAGAAYLYLKRALAIDPANAKAKAELGAVEAALKDGLDLVVLVDRVARAPSAADSACKGIEGPLREALMSDGSKRPDLGAFLLGPDWTALAEKNDKTAPRVSGKLKVTLNKCQNGAGTGNMSLAWELDVPPDGGAAVKGDVDADLPSGIVPRDEQDGEGKNAKKALSKRAAKALFDKLAETRSKIDLWLLTLAEHAMKAKNKDLAADAYARLMIKRPGSIDGARASVVENYLDAEFK